MVDKDAPRDEAQTDEDSGAQDAAPERDEAREDVKDRQPEMGGQHQLHWGG